MNVNSRALNLVLFHTRTLQHRCPPCKAFTPILADFYNANKDNMEIVFLSSDRDEESFSGYFAKMPWLSSVPGYSGGDANMRQRKLAEMFKIQVCDSICRTCMVLWAMTTKTFLTSFVRAKNMLKFLSPTCCCCCCFDFGNTACYPLLISCNTDVFSYNRAFQR